MRKQNKKFHFFASFYQKQVNLILEQNHAMIYFMFDKEENVKYKLVSNV